MAMHYFLDPRGIKYERSKKESKRFHSSESSFSFLRSQCLRARIKFVPRFFGIIDPHTGPSAFRHEWFSAFSSGLSPLFTSALRTETGPVRASTLRSSLFGRRKIFLAMDSSARPRALSALRSFRPR